MRLPLVIVLSAALAWCGTASAQMASLSMPPMAEAKLSAQTRERVSTVKSRIESMTRTGSVQRALTELRLAIDDPKNTPDARSMLLAMNAQIAERTREADQAAALYQQASTVQGAASEVKAQALGSLAALQARQNRPKDAAEAFGAMLQIPALPADSRVVALISRAGVYQAMEKNDEAYADYTAASQVAEASPRHRAIALLQRANVKQAEPHWEQDIGLALAVPEIPAEIRSAALLTRANYYRGSRQTAKALADCQTLLAMPEATPNDKAGAMTIIAEDQISRYEFDTALRGLADALAQPGLSPDTQATAYLTRCKLRMLQSDYAKAYMDLRAAERTDKVSATVAQQIRQQKVLMDGR